MTALPYPRSYWPLPGQLLAGCYPGAPDSAEADRKLQGLLEAGVTCIVSLMEADEKDHRGKPFVPYGPRLQELAQQAGRSVSLHRFSIVDMDVPTVAEMRQTLDFIDGAIERGETVYVHCWGGRGRTGTVVACCLQRRRGMTAAAALEEVRELTRTREQWFWPTPQTREQIAFVQGWREDAPTEKSAS